MDFRGDQPNKQVPAETSGLWVRTDEDDDVSVLARLCVCVCKYCVCLSEIRHVWVGEVE